MEYPREFSTQARARVEAEVLKAGTQLEQQRNQAPRSPFGPVRADEENLRKYILRVFLVFAQEACKLGSQGQWTVDPIRSEAVEFLRRYTGFVADGLDVVQVLYKVLAAGTVLVREVHVRMDE